MTTPISKTQVKTQTAKKVQVKPKEQQKINSTFEKNEPSTAKLAVNRTGAVVMAPLAATAGVLTLVGGFLNGVLNPNTTVDDSMNESIKAAGHGADMLEKMWEGRYF